MKKTFIRTIARKETTKNFENNESLYYSFYHTKQVFVEQTNAYIFIFNFSNYSCANCHSSCASCNGSSESQCILCRSNKFSYEGKCLNTCPDGYFSDKKRKECMQCPVGCATCSGDTCLTCKTDWMKNKKDKCVTNGSSNCDECK